MRAVADLDGRALGRAHVPHDVLGAEAVADGGDPGVALFLEVGEGLRDDGVDVGDGVRVVARAAVLEPAEEVEVVGAVDGELVAVEEVGDDGVVAWEGVSGERVREGKG